MVDAKHQMQDADNRARALAKSKKVPVKQHGPKGSCKLRLWGWGQVMGAEMSYPILQQDMKPYHSSKPSKAINQKRGSR